MGRVAMLVAAAVVAVGAGSGSANAAAPAGVDYFNILGQAVTTVPTMPAITVGHTRVADLVGGPAYVAEVGPYICLNGSCATLADARRGRLAGAVGGGPADPRYVVTQLVPDGIPIVRIGKRLVRVVDNIARATVSQATMRAYLKTSGTGRGLAAFGLKAKG